MARQRNLLHLSKLDEFATWAGQHGWERVACKGTWEVLRLRKRVAFAAYETVIFHVKAGAREHVTSWGQGNALVHQWLRSRGSKP